MTFPLTLLFIFLIFWRPQEWLFPWMYGWPLLDAITYGALLSLLLEAGQGVVRFSKNPAIPLAAGLWFASLMSHVAHGYYAGFMYTAPETFKLCLFLVLLLVVIDRISRLRSVINILLLAAIMMACDALVQYKTGVGFTGSQSLVWFNTVKGQWITQTQFLGIFADPNDLGQYLVACIPFAFVFTRRMNMGSLILAVMIVLLLTEALFTTHSRGALIGAVIVVATMIFLKLPTRWMPYVAVIALFGGLAACAFWGGAFLDESARDRVVFWGNANSYFKSHLLFGGGYGMFAEISGTDRAAHNAFVCCYTELGMFGYWFWFSTMTLAFIGCYRTRLVFRKPRNDEQAYLKRVSGYGMAAMAGFAASSYFLSRAYVFPLFILFGLLNAVPVIAQRYLPEDHRPLINWRQDILVTGTISSMASVIYIYVSILLLNRAYGG